ncbi:MAG: TetR/AcrR family transcriptional regulator [Rhodococcus sp. (in: high G+C Gram-positive bacteria)]
MMVSRAESAAATRAALIESALELLNSGGPEAVTLRAVGARAGVSRGAPYGHFKDKEHLLTQLALDAWGEVTLALDRLIADTAIDPATRLEQALLTLITIGRERPHLYILMFAPPAGDPAVAAQAVGASQDRFLDIVASVVGEQDARRYGALLLSSAQGIANMELSGHLGQEKWNATGEELVATLVQAVQR